MDNHESGSPGKNSLTTAEQSRLTRIIDVLVTLWPDAVPLLDWSDHFGLLCAVILSAQCTDEQVNRVTPDLRAHWPDAASMALAAVDDVEAVIHSVGFYHTKAKHLVEMAGILVARHGGSVPGDMASLLELPGVGRKTANLVLSACFGAPGIIVDTHVLRVATRIGIHGRRHPGEVEQKIATLVPNHRWTAVSHALNRHGKFTCTARNPACLQERASCPVVALCPRHGVE
jgi:endonuclease-3